VGAYATADATLVWNKLNQAILRHEWSPLPGDPEDLMKLFRGDIEVQRRFDAAEHLVIVELNPELAAPRAGERAANERALADRETQPWWLTPARSVADQLEDAPAEVAEPPDVPAAA
jgi:hypothetical protein